VKLYVIILSLLLQGGFWTTCVKASEADLKWKDAIGFAKQGQSDFAFMDFRSILQEYPHSRYSMAAEFALGEYYFLQNNLDMASITFSHFYLQYPHREEAMIALGYLYQIAKMENKPEDVKKYRTKAVSFRHLTFIFKENKLFNFISGLQRKHKLVYYINKVELYVNGQLFTEVPF
jgi:tetratricopeptide (TPR) repeat protein